MRHVELEIGTTFLYDNYNIDSLAKDAGLGLDERLELEEIVTQVHAKLRKEQD